ncbi:MAG: hypothetical protein V9G10_18235 [Candidatus Nanopelagicales bacterium]
MKLRRRLSPGAWLVRGLGWVVLVPALVFALVVQFVPGPARVVRDLIRGPEAAIGAPKPPCSEVRSPRQQPTAGYSDPDGTLRVFAIQYTLDFDDVRDYATWRRTVECLMEDLVQPYRKQGQPTLVVFPEDMGLPTVAMGVRGATARAQSGSVASAVSEAVPLGLGAALGQLNLAYSTQIAAYQARFGPIDPRKQLFVAATDTFARAVNVTFSDIAKQYGVYVVVSNNQATYRETHNPVEVALFSDPSVRTDVAYVATSSRVTNSTFLWGPDDVDRRAPDGMKNLLFRNEKVPLTALEKDLIGLDEGPRSGPAARSQCGWARDRRVQGRACHIVAGFRLRLSVRQAPQGLQTLRRHGGLLRGLPGRPRRHPANPGRRQPRSLGGDHACGELAAAGVDEFGVACSHRPDRELQVQRDADDERQSHGPGLRWPEHDQRARRQGRSHDVRR